MLLLLFAKNKACYTPYEVKGGVLESPWKSVRLPVCR